MKTIIALILGSMIWLNFAAQAEPNAADQKWLDHVEKLIARGETSIATTSQQRAILLKEWAGKQGYAVMIGKFDIYFTVEVFPKIAQR